MGDAQTREQSEVLFPHLKDDPVWRLVQEQTTFEDEQRNELYRIAKAIEVRVRSCYPELHDLDPRPETWPYVAGILLGLHGITAPEQDRIAALEAENAALRARIARMRPHVIWRRDALVRSHRKHGALHHEARRRAVEQMRLHPGDLDPVTEEA